MRSRWPLMVLGLMLAVPVASADRRYGKQVRFSGVHPVAKAHGDGLCYIEGPHVHIYAANKLEYRQHDDDHVFIGDPVAYGWDGPKHSYKGPHPVQIDVEVGGDPHVEHCYLTGPHYHSFDPGDDPNFKVVGDAYFYVGEPPRIMIDARPQYIGINAYYKPLVYTRPVITVDAPVGWIGAHVAFTGPPVVVRPDVRVGADIRIDVPVPSVNIQIGGPAVIVHPRGRSHGKFKHKKFKHKKFKGRR